MEKILVVLNGTKLDMNTVDFACYVANLTKSWLTAIFVDDIIGEEKPALKQLFSLPYVETITASSVEENKEKLRIIEENERVFDQACFNRGVNHLVHHERHARPTDIITESRYADLIIMNSDTGFENESPQTPTRFVKEILAGAECPVLLSPYSFDGIDEILFTYDGSRSSVFAMKQFAHLFPELKTKKATVLQIDEKKILPLKESERIEELIKSHHSQVRFEHLQGKAADELFGYLLGKKNILVVMGAYGRTLLPGFTRPSTADLVVKTINMPIFIAHY